MIRALVLAFAFVLVAASAAQAQQPLGPTHPPTVSPVRVFSQSAIDRAAAAGLTPASARTSSSTVPVPRAKKPFFKTPWPYLIGAGVAIALIAVYAGGNNSSGGVY